MATGVQQISGWPWTQALDALDRNYLFAFRAVRRLDNRQRRAARADNDLRFEALSLIARRALVVFSDLDQRSTDWIAVAIGPEGQERSFRAADPFAALAGLAIDLPS